MGAEVPPRVSAASGPSSMGYVMKAMTRYDASDSYPPSADCRSIIGNCRHARQQNPSTNHTTALTVVLNSTMWLVDVKSLRKSRYCGIGLPLAKVPWMKTSRNLGCWRAVVELYFTVNS